jgi:hypothetical protein
MEILDEPLTLPPGQPIWSTVLRYGLYCGLALILGVQALFHLNFQSTSVSGILIHLLIIMISCLGISYLAIKKQRNILDHGFIRFGKAALLVVCTICFGFLVLAVWNYFFINFFAPDYLQTIKDQTKANWQNQLSATDLERSLAEIDSMKNFSSILKGYMIHEIPLGVLGSIIVAFLMARKR